MCSIADAGFLALCNLTRYGEQVKVQTIAEIAQAHEGSLGMAHAYVDALAATGVTAVKLFPFTKVTEAAAMPSNVTTLVASKPAPLQWQLVQQPRQAESEVRVQSR